MKKRKRTVWVLLRRLVLLGLLFCLMVAFKWYLELPSYQPLLTLGVQTNTKIFARDGSPLDTLMATLPGGQPMYYSISSLHEVSDSLVSAVVTSEDRRFYAHKGVDPLGVVRGFWKALRGERIEGGSTLTNQVIKNTLLVKLEGARTLERKVKEWMLSIQVERHLSKQELLRDYLNVVYWGNGGRIDILGIKAAALAYFGKSPDRLSLAESVYLAVLLPSPKRYFDYQGYRPLMKSLLSRMVEDGRIDGMQAKRAWLDPIEPRGWRVDYGPNGQVLSARLVDRTAKNLNPKGQKATHFMAQLQKELIDRFGQETVFEGGLKVISSLDLQGQLEVERSAQDARLPAGSTLGAVFLDPWTGEVLAMLGQQPHAGQVLSPWNNATMGKRQVGSTIKPLLFATALEQGFDQTHMELDGPISFPCQTCPGGRYEPSNFSRTYSSRRVSMRYALVHSLNLPTLRLADRLGLDIFKEKLEELQLSAPQDAGLSLAIGTLEASPLDMAAAYAPFVGGGVYNSPTYLKRVEDAQGKVLFDVTQNASKRVWTPQTAYVGLDMLQGVVNDLGRNSLARQARIFDRPVGGKTGTTNDVRDLWFVGVTPEMVGSVWVGRQEGGSLPSRYTSGAVSASIWQDMAQGLLRQRTYRDYIRPPGIVEQMWGGRSIAVARQTQAQTQNSDPVNDRSTPQLDGYTIAPP